MRTLQLDLEYEYDFKLYGVVSSSKDYKLAWAINRLFGFRLVKQKDLCYNLWDKERLLIANYHYETELSSVRLFRNKALGLTTLKKPFLLPDIKEYDYILQIAGALQALYPHELISKLQLNPLVQYVKQFDPLTLKFKENLLF